MAPRTSSWAPGSPDWSQRTVVDALSAGCTHLGGTLQWNDAEESWDCPLHGSRFAPSGEVLGDGDPPPSLAR